MMFDAIKRMYVQIIYKCIYGCVYVYIMYMHTYVRVRSYKNICVLKNSNPLDCKTKCLTGVPYTCYLGVYIHIHIHMYV